MTRAIARNRGVGTANILPGAGSSGLIYLAFRQWLDSNSHVLIVDPTYGDYAHILENVIGCQVHRLLLKRSNGYVIDLAELQARARLHYDLIVLVNPRVQPDNGKNPPQSTARGYLKRPRWSYCTTIFNSLGNHRRVVGNMRFISEH